MGSGSQQSTSLKQLSFTVFLYRIQLGQNAAQQAQNRHTTSQDVGIWLNFGCDVGWPKSNVNPTSNVNVKLMSNTDVSWRWDLVVFRLCNQNPTLSQRQIDVKYWRQPDFHFQPKSNVCLTSCPTSTWRYIDVWCLLGGYWGDYIFM